MYLWIYAASTVWWFSRTTERLSIVWFGAIVLALSSSGFATVHVLRYNCQCKKQLPGLVEEGIFIGKSVLQVHVQRMFVCFMTLVGDALIVLTNFNDKPG